MNNLTNAKNQIVNILNDNSIRSNEALDMAYTVADESNLKLSIISANELVELVPAIKRSNVCPDFFLFKMSTASFNDYYVIFDKNTSEIVAEVEGLISAGR